MPTSDDGPPTTPPWRVLVAEDHLMVREGLIALLKQDERIEVAARASTASEVKQQLRAHSIDLLLLDLMLGDSDGVTLIKDLLGEFSGLRVLVISAHNDPLFAERSLKAGALGFITKEEPAASIFDAIKEVMEGRFAITESLASSILKRRLKHPGPTGELNISSLSDRELHVFTLLGKGLTSRQISVQLKISIKTVDAHREHIKSKLMLENSSHLIRHAVIWVQHQEASRSAAL
ncbi:MAG: DNA-binding response regulator [Verrucomicrobia bacterium]|nr:MAG: DNA-binding response regulator [Verrucomicrobiota bacterium]